MDADAERLCPPEEPLFVRLFAGAAALLLDLLLEPLLRGAA